MIEACTLTGIDAGTDLRAAVALAEEYPELEYGILYSPAGGECDPRYMDAGGIEAAACALHGKAALSLHLCGRAVDMFVEGALPGFAALFGRIQVNVEPPDDPGFVAALDAAMPSAAVPVITQHNPANAAMTRALASPNHQVLFDASLGRGLRAETHAPPLPGKFCGYAGGFGPATVMEDVAAVLAATAGERCWIDMETRLRTDGCFDLALCRKTLSGLRTFRA